MTPWYLSEWVGFDTETTGVNVEDDRIVTAALVWCVAGEPVETRTWLSDAGGIEIPLAATKIHGISTAYARKFGRPGELMVRRIAWLLAREIEAGRPIVAMNARFDLTLLDRELARYGQPSLAEQAGREPYVLDPIVLDKQVDKFRPGSRNLTALCRHYEVELNGAHRADADAIAAARVTYQLACKYPELRAPTLPELHEQQTVWAREQAASLQTHLRQKDPAAVVDGDWPLIPRQGGTP
jgi:DNA polymerase-3 subunit epsilon